MSSLEHLDRVKVWTGTIHWANEEGRPLCGSARRTHTCWTEPTSERVTCSRCQRIEKDPDELDKPKDTSLRPRPGETAEQTVERVVNAVRKENTQ